MDKFKATFELEMTSDDCTITALNAGIPLCEWSGDISQIGLGFLELVTLLDTSK